jgi:excisionase family DNA binding protein
VGPTNIIGGLSNVSRYSDSVFGAFSGSADALGQQRRDAADMLNVSRPSPIQLLDQGKIEYRKVGTHRRVRFESLMKFKRQAEADRRAALAELAHDQKLGS